MILSSLRENLPDYAKDVKLNLSSVLTEEGAPGLTEKQIWGTALACTYSTKDPAFIAEIQDEALKFVGDAEKFAAKAAASIMAMNNIYYRTVHFLDHDDYNQLPAKLRMTIMAKSGIEKRDFELYAFAISAINACSGCVRAHEKTLRAEDFSSQAVQSAMRIAAVISSAHQAYVIR